MSEQLKSRVSAAMQELSDINSQIERQAMVTSLMKRTEAIGGKLKVLLRSLYLPNGENSVFDLKVGDGGDHFLVEDLINEIEKLHYAIAELG